MVVAGPRLGVSPAVLEGFAWDDGALVRARVVQCALSRVCGVCGRPLTRPIAFVGTADEAARGTFHAPPLHDVCATALLAAPGGPTARVDTGGYEFVRPAKDDPDPLPRFVPHPPPPGGVAGAPGM